MFKNFCIQENLKLDRYESSIKKVLLELKRALIDKLTFLKKGGNIDFQLKYVYRQFEEAFKKQHATNDFSNYAIKFTTIEVPEYKDPTKTISIDFYYTLDSNVTHAGLSNGKDVLLNLKPQVLLNFVMGDKAIVEYIEDNIVHEITHIIDPGFNASDKTIKKIVSANIKADKGDDEEYYNLHWEKVAFHTQNVRRFIQNILKSEQFKNILKTKDVEKVKVYLENEYRKLKDYIDTRYEIKDKKKLYKEVYKEIVYIISEYSNFVKEM